MRGDEAEHQRRLIVGVEISPVHGDDEFPAFADRVVDPEREHGPDVDPLVAQETINLLDCVFGRLAARLRERLTDDRDRERRAGHHPKHPVR